MKPNRVAIEAYITQWWARSKGLVHPADVNSTKLYMLVGSNIGWDWDVDDVGLAPNPRTGEPCPWAGMHHFLEETFKKVSGQ